MEELQDICPKPDGIVPLRIPCNGDQMSVERMTNVKRGRVRARSYVAKLDALVETPQEFHKEGLIMQVGV